MNVLENKMIETLIDLRKNYHVLSVKAEFEAEGTRLDEALLLKNIVDKAGIDLTIKIGGCEAIKDLYEAKEIGASSIVTPMIETPYAFKKFVHAIDTVFTEYEQQNFDFYINIETITGYENLRAIITSSYFNKIKGVVLGRVDMAGSLELSRENVNSDKIFEIANSISHQIYNTKKEFVVGGGVSTQSVPFFSKLPFLSKFETRKIIFDAQNSLNNKNSAVGIIKAIEFETMWIKNKKNLYGKLLKEDENRLNLLEKLIEKSYQTF